MAVPFYKRVGQFIHKHERLEFWLDRIIHPFEVAAKRPAFGCQMCGQCVLHSTGMTCPMTCPKSLRNGPCGGVDLDGSCEVDPTMTCIWVNAYHRSQKLPWPEEIHDLRPPVDWSLNGSSSWINLLTEKDQISSGCAAEPKTALEMVAIDDKAA
jgi:hypothetical protein